MLAIITRMTLTQVSTWFANARRRLKKENVIGDDFDSDGTLEYSLLLYNDKERHSHVDLVCYMLRDMSFSNWTLIE